MTHLQVPVLVLVLVLALIQKWKERRRKERVEEVKVDLVPVQKVVPRNK
jgi:hypothetical protein